MIAPLFRASACLLFLLTFACVGRSGSTPPRREVVELDDDWRFYKYGPAESPDSLIYDVRPVVTDASDDRPADSRPEAAASGATAPQQVLKPWVLPSGNRFIKDPAKRFPRPEGNPGHDFPFVQNDFDDGGWQAVTLPHDWAIAGPFLETGPYGGMGRLPSWGVAWYRRKLDLPSDDAGKRVYLEVDGAMSYAMVWLNGQLVGGWPYGYSSWRLDLTPYIAPGRDNQLAIRLDNPPSSSRWYPGGGIYRHVRLVKTSPVHVAHWGTFITTRAVSAESATVDIEVTVDNTSNAPVAVEVTTELYTFENGRRGAAPVATAAAKRASVPAGEHRTVKGSAVVVQPRLWGPPPSQRPHRYVALTTVRHDGQTVDQYETRFGIRTLRFDSDQGLFVNGERIPIQGVNQHHDLGALGAAFNVRAARRQLDVLREMGCNAIRMSHNPPAPELLDLTDEMGFLVMDESFDVWERKKTPLDFHLIFPEWHEQDTRAMVRRDRNHPSVVIWSIGNEVGEQYTAEAGAAVAARLRDIVRDEDPTRPITSAMNYAKPDMRLPEVIDLISLNYQGEGIRDLPEFEGTNRIRTPPLYSAFHDRFPEKLILSSETASAFSSRGVYFFPVSPEISAPVRDGRGGDSKLRHVTSYELHAVDFGSTADKVFRAQDRHPYVAGEFVWTGWDYLGEPTPYYDSRSSYCGIVDLAGFRKDRFYLYQSRWRPDHPMAHILPHWTWPERVGQVTPVHVFTSGDSAELFLNGRSLGRKTKAEHEYRLRWDDVVYEPGILHVIAYRHGRRWAEATMKTAGEPAALAGGADRTQIAADGRDLAFVEISVVDRAGNLAPRAVHPIRFSVDGPGELVATDNGDPTSFVPFPSPERPAFSGKCLAIVRGRRGGSGTIRVIASSEGLEPLSVQITTRSDGDAKSD